MIASDDKDLDPRRVQPANLVGEKSGRLHRRLIAVVQIPRQQQRVDLLGQTQIDETDKSTPGRVSDEFSELRIAKHERPERRIQMNVSGVNKAIRHHPPLSKYRRTPVAMTA